VRACRRTVMTGCHDPGLASPHCGRVQRRRPTPQRLTELVELVSQLLDAQGRRHGLPVGSDAWAAVTLEIEDLTQRVWRPDEVQRADMPGRRTT
jgi:hypothetical protein